APVIALLGLIELMEVSIELLLARPGRAVDTLKHRLRRVTSPIGASNLEQLEPLADLSRRSHVRPAAEVDPVALRIGVELIAFGHRPAQPDFEGPPLLLEHLLRLLAISYPASERPIASHDLAHLRFDLGQILGRERLVACEVVIEAILDDWADGDLRAG